MTESSWKHLLIYLVTLNAIKELANPETLVDKYMQSDQWFEQTLYFNHWYQLQLLNPVKEKKRGNDKLTKKYGLSTEMYKFAKKKKKKKGRILGSTVLDGWAGAVKQKTLAFRKCYRRIDERKERHGKV